ncbi:acetyl-CoA acetyltransferase, cytosolic 1-like [Cucurbita maxima]|uniref:Acetyl-CoA acetyltransferase, cytosolic 1-like n=1 Tax=Cucurbita maxima TaxID=3661 RepID=A0A6J1IDN5_CUCMA|nr:acetyl-CoA acetyltransferase, cytosolic 1-like [Cucurbita maxima]XP_022973139.1 acetyl-CoA acetyltransferase, cytosolic 1-like [Cucurbita maxima]
MAPLSSDSINPRDVCIVGVARTPIGAFLGSLSSFSATQLGSIAIECALKRANVDPSLVQEVFFGNVLSANLGQAPARQAALGAGIPNSVICTTINKVCASGMKATMIAAHTIQLGINDVVVSGGMESMSNVPKYLQLRKGSRFGNDTVVDGMLKDGLWDVYNDFAMGVCGEMCASQHSITREDQDAYAIKSFERGLAAQNNGQLSWEIAPVKVPSGRGKPSSIFDKDESLRQFDAAKLRKLRPSFKEDGGTVTAGNASIISDGAAALVLVSGKKAVELGLEIIAVIKGYADAAQAPELFTTAPALSIPKAISNAGLHASQIDYYEINEAFSVVALANQKLLGLDPDRVNVHGGAVSLGHPLGCSGARILVTLLGVLRQRNGKYGVGAVCNGGGGASALVVELMPGARVRHSKL